MNHSHLRLPPVPLESMSHRSGYSWFVISTVCFGAFMAALDASIVNIALPTIQRQLHTSFHGITWVSLIYLLTLSALIIPFGRLADMYGRRSMYTLGFVVFVIGSTLCGVSTSLTFLLGARVLQAVGAAMLQANSVAIVTSAAPVHARGKAIGIQGSAQAAGLTLGPAIGGILLTYLSWRWIFYVNLPVGCAGIIFAWLLLPRDEPAAHREHFDFLGMLLISPTLVALIYSLNTGMHAGWAAPSQLALYACIFMGLYLFILAERHARAPLIDLHMFRIPAFTIGSITGVLSFTVMYAVTFIGPFYLDHVALFSSMRSGLFMTFVPIGMTCLTPISGSLADRFGARGLTAIGMTISAIGCGLLGMLGLHTVVPLLIAGLFLIGVGLGLFTPPNNSSVMSSAPTDKLGVAGGLLNMARTLGMEFGVTAGGVLYQLFLFLSIGRLPERPSLHSMAYSYQDTFLGIGVISCLAAILSVTKRRADECV